MIKKLLKQLASILAFIVPMRTPLTPEAIESIVEPIRAVYDPSGDGLGIRRHVSEAIMHRRPGLLVTRLQYLLDVRRSIATGNAFVVLQEVKKEEKARAEQAAKEATTNVAT